MSQSNPSLQGKPNPEIRLEQQQLQDIDGRQHGSSGLFTYKPHLEHTLKLTGQPITQEVVIDFEGAHDGLQSSKAVPYSSRQYPMKVAAAPEYPRRRPQSPGLKWYKPFSGPECFKKGRVLVIDYIKLEESKQDMRKVAAQEFDDIKGLRHFYSTPDRVGTPILRVVHCQNADWATRFLLRKFNINSQNDLVGTDFGKWVKYKRAERRGGKPFLNGKTWQTTHDPWRGISRSSFGLDYLKHYKPLNYHYRPTEGLQEKMFELNHYDDEDNPKYGFDVNVQRLSCYIQHKDTVSVYPNYPGVESPYNEAKDENEPHKYVPQLDSLDNGNVIIIFEKSTSNTVWDTLVAARQQWESKWRRLPFYLGVEPNHDYTNDDSMALECMKIILSDIWKSVADNWEDLLNVCETHISILEEKIYDGPADESRAPELWTNSNVWLKVERLVGVHVALVREMQTNLKELTGDPDDIWLETASDDMKRLTERVQDDLVKPTTNLTDLMYKSVEIRDSRHSLQLNTSMWRLSWITFIFLPLTFICSFFGMNVNTFDPNPSIKYYFASALPLMFLVLLFWYFIKHGLAHERQTPYQRGIYEEMFYKLANENPKLWSRAGPREGIKPQSVADRLKWRLITSWNDPRKTIQKGPGEDNQYDDLGAWARFKRILTRRWTNDITNFEDLTVPSTLENGSSSDDEISMLTEKTNVEPIYAAASVPKTATGIHQENRLGVLRPALMSETVPIHSRTSVGGPDSAGKRASSKESESPGRSSGIMVEEEPSTWLKDFAAPKIKSF